MAERVIRVIDRDAEPPKDASGRPPPQDLACERAVLSSIILDNRLNQVRDLLDEDVFRSDAHQIIYRAICALDASSTAIDIVTVVGRLRDTEQLQRAGGEKYLVHVLDSTPAIQNLPEHARRLARLKLVRSAIAAMHRHAAEGYGAIDDTQAYLDGAASELGAIARAGHALDAKGVMVGQSVEMALHNVWRGIEADDIAGMRSGLFSFDEATAGLHTGDYNVITAKTGGGKTAFCTMLATNVAKTCVRTDGRRGGGAAIFSLEMLHEEISQRMACTEGRVNWHAIRLNVATEQDYANLVKGSEAIKGLPIIIDDQRPATIRQIRGRILRHRDTLRKRGVDLKLVVIDYLQIIQTDDRARSRERELTIMARGLPKLAKELGVCIVGGAQLNADGDIRESKGLGHWATGRWDLKVDKKSSSGARTARIHISKQRHAPHPVDVSFYFHPAYVTFSDYEVLGDGSP